MICRAELLALREMDTAACPPQKLADVTLLKINTQLPVAERLEQFIAGVNNPYLFRVKSTVVRVRYNQPAVTLQERLEQLALSNINME